MKRTRLLSTILSLGVALSLYGADNVVTFRNGEHLKLTTNQGIELNISTNDDVSEANPDATIDLIPTLTADKAGEKIMVGDETLRAFISKTVKVETNRWPTIHIDFFQSYQSHEPQYFDNVKFFDFEVKATTNNFQTLVYYYLSTATNQFGPYQHYNFCDKGADVMYKDAEFRHRWDWGDFREGWRDGRVWLKKHRLASIYDCVQDITKAYVTSIDLIVSTNQVVWENGVDVPQDTSWMYEHNPDLQWVITRIDPIDSERISTGTHPFYNATPIWSNERKHSHWAIYAIDNPRGGISDFANQISPRSADKDKEMVHWSEQAKYVEKSYKDRYAPPKVHGDDETIVIHPLSSIGMKNNVCGEIASKAELCKSKDVMREVEQYEFSKAIWVYNAKGDDNPLREFASRHNKKIVGPLTNNALGRIREGAVFRWSCKSCGYAHSTTYTRFVTGADFHVRLTGFEELTASCPKCGK